MAVHSRLQPGHGAAELWKSCEGFSLTGWKDSGIDDVEEGDSDALCWLN